MIIGGGIANFTNVADTFKGLIRAIREAKSKLRENNTQVFVRRGGPNHLEGLRLMRELGGQIDLPIHVYGPETHMTAIVAMALGLEPIEDPKPTEDSTANFSLPTMVIIQGRQWWWALRDLYPWLHALKNLSGSKTNRLPGSAAPNAAQFTILPARIKTTLFGSFMFHNLMT